MLQYFGYSYVEVSNLCFVATVYVAETADISALDIIYGAVSGLLQSESYLYQMLRLYPCWGKD